jgi:hypothetical protein
VGFDGSTRRRGYLFGTLLRSSNGLPLPRLAAASADGATQPAGWEAFLSGGVRSLGTLAG